MQQGESVQLRAWEDTGPFLTGLKRSLTVIPYLGFYIYLDFIFWSVTTQHINKLYSIPLITAIL